MAARFSNDESRWQALVQRDCSADGVFYYSVRTTGVFCRPSCAARLPRRSNVRFHSSCAEAQRAGFRPCKRCRPGEISLAERQRDIVARACRRLEQVSQAPSLSSLAGAAGMSPHHFHKVFKMITGVTPKAYADGQRAQRLRTELAKGEAVTAAMCLAGFQSSGRFYARAEKDLGMTPTAFRSGGKGADVRYTVGQCSLGTVLVAASDRGICAIMLGDDAGELASDLRDQFPEARIAAGDSEFQDWVNRTIALIEQPAVGAALPLDIRGTAFQLRVWQSLQRIPPGSSASYAEIARRLGQPRAVRAVARACAANRIAVAIPCHRAIRSDGSLAGYRWGVERKIELLRREQKTQS